MSIQAVNAGPSGTPTQIVRDGCRTVVHVTVGIWPDGFVQLPTGCLPGDVFEIYLDNSANQSGYVIPPSSEGFSDPSLPQVGGVGCLSGSGVDRASFIVRKLASTRWGYIRG